MHGTSRVVWGRRENIKSVYLSDSQLLLSRPSVSGTYFENTQEKQLLGYQLYCTVSSSVRSRCVCFFLAVESFRTTASIYVDDSMYLRRTERKYWWTDSLLLESCSPTDYVVFRTCRLVVLSSIWPITELYSRHILSTDSMNRLYLVVKKV